MTIKNNKDFWAGALFMLFGIGAAVVAQENELGTLSRMGPGFFPTALGLILALLGAVISVRALVEPVANETDGQISPVQWGVLFFILGSVALFALSLLTVGLLGSITILVVTSSLAAGKDRRPLERSSRVNGFFGGALLGGLWLRHWVTSARVAHFSLRRERWT